MARSIFEAEFVSKFDPKKALSVKGGLVDIRIAERWCQEEKVPVSALKMSVFFHWLSRIILWIGIVVVAVSFLVGLFFAIRFIIHPRQGGIPESVIWKILTPMITGLGLMFIPLFFLSPVKILYWDFAHYVARLRKQVALEQGDVKYCADKDLDQDAVMYCGDKDLEESAISLISAERRAQEYADTMGIKIDRKIMLDLCVQWDEKSRELSTLYKLYARSYPVEKQGTYVSRAQVELGLKSE